MEGMEPSVVASDPAARPCAAGTEQTRCIMRKIGFTLIELMIVMVVIAIIALVVVPTFRDPTSMRLREAARLVVADIEAVRIQSLTNSQDPRLLVIDSAANRYYIAAASDPSTPLINPIGNVPYDTTLGVGRAAMARTVSIQSHTFGADNRVQFGTYGQLDQATAANLVLAADGMSVTISIDPVTGEASVSQVQ
jgi:prepilin-type N-terminal cleavage/methylation domain-containing protein